jgi:hypothetical protein
MQDLMQDVFVRPEPPGRFTAQAVMAPDVKATADTEQAAVEQVRQALAARLSNAKLVTVKVPVGSTANPWLDHFGRFKDDPQYDDYLEEIRKAREAMDEP